MNEVYVNFSALALNVEVYNEKRKLIFKKRRPNYEFLYDYNNRIIVENIIPEIYDIFDEVLKNNPRDTKVFLSSFGHSLILLDKDKRPIDKGYCPIDNVSSNVEQNLKKKLKKINGLINGGYLPIFKIKNANYENLSEWTTLKGWILINLIQENIIEITDASSSGFLDYKQRCFSETIMKLVDKKNLIYPSISKKDINYKFEYKGYNFLIGTGISEVYAKHLAITKKENNISSAIDDFICSKVIVNKAIQVDDKLDFCYPITNGKYIYGYFSKNGINNIKFVLSQLDIDYEKLNELDFSDSTIEDGQVSFFKEDDYLLYQQKVLTYNFTKNTIFTIISQIVDKVNDFRTNIELKLNKKCQLFISGKGLKIKDINNQLKNLSNNNFTFKEVEEANPINGMKEYFKKN